MCEYGQPHDEGLISVLCPLETAQCAQEPSRRVGYWGCHHLTSSTCRIHHRITQACDGYPLPGGTRHDHTHRTITQGVGRSGMMVTININCADKRHTHASERMYRRNGGCEHGAEIACPLQDVGLVDEEPHQQSTEIVSERRTRVPHALTVCHFTSRDWGSWWHLSAECSSSIIDPKTDTCGCLAADVIG